MPGDGTESHLAAEIREQAAVAARILARRRPGPGTTTFDDLALTREVLLRTRRVLLVGMGSAYHAAAMGAMYLEALARLPAQAELATRWAGRSPVVERDTLLLCISQSGTTADTLRGLQEAAARGATTIAVVNAEGSPMEAAADGVIRVGAGEELAVASTKAFTAQVLNLLLFALYVRQARGAVQQPRVDALFDALAGLPGALDRATGMSDAAAAVADRWVDTDHIICLGAEMDGIAAEEAAVKLKELTYAHAEGFDAAAFRHGPVAMLDERYCVLALIGPHADGAALADRLAEYRLRTRGVVAVGSAEALARVPVDERVTVPAVPRWLFPLVALPPVQWLGFHLARRRGLDVDRPRYLRKSLT